jgi:hypothetical protein
MKMMDVCCNLQDASNAANNDAMTMRVPLIGKQYAAMIPIKCYWQCGAHAASCLL